MAMIYLAFGTAATLALIIIVGIIIGMILSRRDRKKMESKEPDDEKSSRR
ncbi:MULTISPECIES: hypothetical protein [Aneurinibacillus]|jgi:uncharacterized protein YneF (UPF0154 family)|uniref:Uncharacterized protein n=1 Tax=Aneurinibacillus danicus TaxID=267746 RepID=A0A511V9X5_9BACL|nr:MULTISPECIES: hypothetical protein [Aneurinibacillus]GEN35724.1 hypothetical protein ADA01nite_31840 [Aneurinibacillus danicus]